MPKILLINGAKFNLWKPHSETRDFEPIIREHAKEIFGMNSIYFDIKPELRSSAGIGSKPDGFVIVLDEPAFHVVEVEKAEHEVHDHVVIQISKFNSALKKPETKTKIVKAMYNEITSHPEIEVFVKSKIHGELYKYLTELIESPPTVVIVIDELMDKLNEAVGELPLQSKIIEFQTFKKEDEPNFHAHLFEPLSHGTKFQTTQTMGLREQQYLNFYQELANKLKDKVPTAVAKPKPSNYCQIGTPSLHFEWRFIGKMPERTFLVELHLESPKKEINLARINELKKYSQDIEKVTGETVFFQENWGRSCSRLYLERKKTEMTEDLKIWAVEKMAAMYRLLQPKLVTMP